MFAKGARTNLPLNHGDCSRKNENHNVVNHKSMQQNENSWSRRSALYDANGRREDCRKRCDKIIDDRWECWVVIQLKKWFPFGAWNAIQSPINPPPDKQRVWKKKEKLSDQQKAWTLDIKYQNIESKEQCDHSQDIVNAEEVSNFPASSMWDPLCERQENEHDKWKH